MGHITLAISIISLIVSYLSYRSTKKDFDSLVKYIADNHKYEWIDDFHVSNPLLFGYKDLFYSGKGETWGEDINGKRYYKVFFPKYIKYNKEYWVKSKIKFGQKLTPDVLSNAFKDK